MRPTTFPMRNGARSKRSSPATASSGEPLEQLVDTVTADKKHWVDFMMRFELGLEKPDPRRAPLSAARIGGSYVIGGLLPLLPYMLVPQSQQALWGSIVVTFIALVVFGALKGKFTGSSVRALGGRNRSDRRRRGGGGVRARAPGLRQPRLALRRAARRVRRFRETTGRSGGRSPGGIRSGSRRHCDAPCNMRCGVVNVPSHVHVPFCGPLDVLSESVPSLWKSS